MRKTLIFFDVSVLIAGTLDSKSRTGVYRYVQNILEELKKAPDLEIEFVVGENIGFLPEMHRIQSSWMIFLAKIRKYLGRHLNVRPRSIENLRAREIELLTNNRALYFSPFHKIPKYIPSKLYDKCFITIYDLIPIKFPEYFKENANIELIQDIIFSITPEMTVFCISECTKHDLLSARPDLHSKQIHVTHLAASKIFYHETDRDKINAVKVKYGIPLTGQYILSLCTLEPRKNIPAVIRAYEILKKNPLIKNLTLVLVGAKGWLNQELALDTCIVVTGYAADCDLAALYSGACCFVYPSFYEGFGLPPLEAMQCGVPVITSNTASLPEVVGQAGLMVSPSDVPALAAQILLVITDDKLRENLQKKALAQAQLFAWEKTASILINKFKSI